MKNYLPIIDKYYKKYKIKQNLKRNDHKCYICRNTFKYFIPYRGGRMSASSFIRELKCIGSDVDNYLCPHCSSIDLLLKCEILVNKKSIIANLPPGG